eukprot:359814-Chlamydomonas_euryale.AAC.8
MKVASMRDCVKAAVLKRHAAYLNALRSRWACFPTVELSGCNRQDTTAHSPYRRPLLACTDRNPFAGRSERQMQLLGRPRGSQCLGARSAASGPRLRVLRPRANVRMRQTTGTEGQSRSAAPHTTRPWPRLPPRARRVSRCAIASAGPDAKPRRLTGQLSRVSCAAPSGIPWIRLHKAFVRSADSAVSVQGVANRRQARLASEHR